LLGARQQPRVRRLPSQRRHTIPNSTPPSGPKDSRRTPGGVFEAWDKRTELVKQQIRAESAATDAKTARLRALRLAKEAEDAQAARLAAESAPPPPAAKKRVKRGG
jgi:hypothetical protein